MWSEQKSESDSKAANEFDFISCFCVNFVHSFEAFITQSFSKIDLLILLFVFNFDLSSLLVRTQNVNLNKISVICFPTILPIKLQLKSDPK